MEIDARRSAKVIKFGDSVSMTLTKELELIGIKVDDDVLVTVTEGRIEIVPKDYYYNKSREEAGKG